jgi:hypothetical protein
MTRNIIKAAIIIIVTLLIFYPLARAQDHQHPDKTITGATARFYETWMRPDMPTVSCCNKMDCDVAVEVKHHFGQWWARKAGGPLISIPAEKVEQGRDSPDGQSHLCSIGGTVLCFLPASGQ